VCIVQENRQNYQQFKKYFLSVVFLSIYLYTTGMDINKIIMNAGSQSELARMLGVERGAVWLWKRNGVIPKSRLWQIQLHFPELLKDKT
jgi:DNA invertase Pin-like site-specific DNA recombinase